MISLKCFWDFYVVLHPRPQPGFYISVPKRLVCLSCETTNLKEKREKQLFQKKNKLKSGCVFRNCWSCFSAANYDFDLKVILVICIEDRFLNYLR